MSLPFFEFASQRLDQLVKPGMLCGFDFDGTLAPIVKEPDWVFMPVPISRRLATLATLTPVTIITGRSVADVEKRLDFEPHFIVGNHGLEGMPGSDQLEAGYEKTCLEWAEALRPALSDKKRFDPGIRLENKACSLSIHYRLARDRVYSEAQLIDLIKQVAPSAHVMGGKCVLNLMPSNTINKGVAFERLMAASGASSALYVGDDVTDEDVFRLQRADLLSVRIERADTTAAEYYLHHRLGMVQLLDELIKRLGTLA